MDEKTTKEINLMDILIAIWGWIVKGVKAVIRTIGLILQLLFRHKILVIISMLVCFGVSQYFARKDNRRYNVDAMAVLHGPQAQTVMQIGNQLSLSSQRFTETSIGHKLGLNDSIAKKIAAIKFYNVIDYQKDSVPDLVDFHRNHSLSDTVNVKMRDHVYIRLQLIGTNHADEISNAVLNYINSNPVVRTDYETQINEYKQQIVVLDAEAKRIDSLAKIKYFEDEKTQIRLQNNQLLVGNQQKQLFYGDLLLLQSRKSLAEKRIAEAKSPVVVPSGFIINPKSLNGRITNGVYGLVLGLLLGLVLSFIIENLKKWLIFLSNK